MPELRLNPIGDTGIIISEIGLGTVKFGRNSGVKYPESFTIPDDDSLLALLEQASHLGLNYLDTAPAYGTSEEKLGKLLSGQSDHWIISTKVGEYYDNNVSRYDFSRDTTLRSIESSLTRLNRAVLDIVFVHSNGQDQQVIEETAVLATLQDCKNQGLIRAIGFSGKDASGTARALDVCDVFMITLNEEDQTQASLIKLCEARNRGVVIKKALTSGHSRDPASALRFVSQYPGVTSTIVGTINPVHLTDNIQAVVKAV